MTANKGHIVQVIGAVVDVAFPEGICRTSSTRLRSIISTTPTPRISSAKCPASGQQRGAHHRHGQYGRSATRHESGLYRKTHHHAGGRTDSRTGHERRRRSHRGMQALDETGAFPIHRDPPKFEDLSTTQEVLFTGHQSDRPVGTLSERRKNRIVRRGGRRKNGINQGAHQQHCQKA